MPFIIRKVDIWAVDMLNRPGMLARVLESLSNAGANLEFVVARRITENTSRAFVAPIRGSAQTRAARQVDMVLASGMHCLRVEGPDRPGLGAELTRRLGDSNLNLRGLSAASIEGRSVCYVAFAAESDCRKAATILSRSLRNGPVGMTRAVKVKGDHKPPRMGGPSAAKPARTSRRVPQRALSTRKTSKRSAKGKRRRR
ncbi:MAG: hypothetical protein CHACPFDD_02762 [Phycisphaerae bacterium]|nr:hypothetical protein [Phycisphaerae bacterium]